MLHSAPRGSLCTVAFTATEADLEAFSPGRAAAHDGHGRLAEGDSSHSTVYSCEHRTLELPYVGPSPVVFGECTVYSSIMDVFSLFSCYYAVSYPEALSGLQATSVHKPMFWPL